MLPEDAQRRPVRPDRQLGAEIGLSPSEALNAQRRPVRPDRQLRLGDRPRSRRQRRSTKAGPAGPATPARVWAVPQSARVAQRRPVRPDRQLLVHRRRGHPHRARSTKAGPAGPATRRSCRCAGSRRCTLNEGRSGRTGNSRPIEARHSGLGLAQRRPVRPDRQLIFPDRSAGTRYPAAQRRPVRPDRQLMGAVGGHRRARPRSTKAGPAGPATLAMGSLLSSPGGPRSTKAGPAGPATPRT